MDRRQGLAAMRIPVVRLRTLVRRTLVRVRVASTRSTTAARSRPALSK
jgi:hypothetical protein